MRNLATFFFTRITTEDRLLASTAPESIRILRDPFRHPIHVLQANVDVEEKLSRYVQAAFGLEVRVHRNAGKEVPLMCGAAPSPCEGQDRLSPEYLRRLDELPRVESQGDGIRSFVGLILHALTIPYNLLLVDEPEAFLHPPQARLVGRFLATEVPTSSQLFLATHSGEVIKGLMDAQSRRVRVIRICRDGCVNRIRELSSESIVKLWSDPLVRHSNVLDGLFHEHVVVCESEGDCRFFDAMVAATPRPKALAPTDFHFVSASGKDRLHVIASALRAVGVPLAVVADFDVIAEQSKFQRLVESCGLTWTEVSADWKLVWSSIDKRKPDLDRDEVRRELLAILDASRSSSSLPEKDSESIRRLLLRTSSWQTAKNAGVSLIPSGDEANACQRLLDRCKAAGLFILACGELERFCKSIGGHGPSWVNAVLQRDLANAPDLRSAREFVQELVGGHVSGPHQC